MSSIQFARRTLTAALPLATTLAIAPTARAEPLPPFGRAGQVVLDDLIGVRSGAPGYLGQIGFAGPSTGVLVSALGYTGLLGYAHSETSSTNPANLSYATNAIWVAPAFDVFVAPRLSLGMGLGVSYMWQSSADPPPNGPYAGVPAGTGWSLSAVPRIGYVWPIAPRLAIWPRLGIGYAHARSEQHLGASWTQAAQTSTWLGGVEVKLVFQATRHLFLDVATNVSLRHMTTDLGSEVTRNFSAGMGGTVGMGIVL
jgi:hypothetical protein